MKVTFDDQIFLLQSRGGVSRYFAEIIHEYRSSPELGVQAVTPYKLVANHHLVESDSRFRLIPKNLAIQHPRSVRSLNRLMNPRAPQSDVVHHTFYEARSLAIRAKARICTIYDMIPEMYPELFPEGSPHANKRQLVDECDGLLCISETIKDDLESCYGALDKPVFVTPLGVSSRYFHDEPSQPQDPPYVLHIGQRGGYKNFWTLLLAFARVLKATADLKLLCTGPPFHPEEFALFEQWNIADRVERVELSDSELPRAYAGAMCTVVPSLYEGFGLPVLEAFAAGCPVIAAKTPALCETGGDCALYFDPRDDGALAETIIGLTRNPSMCEQYIIRGRVRAREYSWQQTAQLTARAYEAIVSDV